MPHAPFIQGIMTQKNRSRSFPLLFAAAASADDFAHAQPPPQLAQCWRCARACVFVCVCEWGVCVAFLLLFFIFCFWHGTNLSTWLRSFLLFWPTFWLVYFCCCCCYCCCCCCLAYSLFVRCTLLWQQQQ